MTDPIVIKLSVDDLTASINKILCRDSSILSGNPLAHIVVDAIKEASPRIAQVVRNITAEFVASDEFAKKIRAIYREAICGEASRMGVNAARAAVNAKDGAQ